MHKTTLIILAIYSLSKSYNFHTDLAYILIYTLHLRAANNIIPHNSSIKLPTKLKRQKLVFSFTFLSILLYLNLNYISVTVNGPSTLT